MARPTKNNCDYFSHDKDMRNHRKVKALRHKFKTTGYAVWNMLLEYLTGADGNVFEDSEHELELMSGDFDVSVTEIREILDYCIRMEMLFEKKGFIHSESLDERLSPVYEKRKVAKSLSKKQLRSNGKFVICNTEPVGVSVTEMPQSKVKESKVKETTKSDDDFENDYQDEMKELLLAQNETLKEDMIVKEMLKVWMKYNPKYQYEEITDYPALLNLAYKIGKTKNWSKDDVIKNKLPQCLTSWEKIVVFIKQHDFYKQLAINMIEKKWAGLYQTMDAYKECSKKVDVKDPTKIKISL